MNNSNRIEMLCLLKYGIIKFPYKYNSDTFSHNFKQCNCLCSTLYSIISSTEASGWWNNIVASLTKQLHLSQNSWILMSPWALPHSASLASASFSNIASPIDCDFCSEGGWAWQYLPSLSMPPSLPLPVIEFYLTKQALDSARGSHRLRPCPMGNQQWQNVVWDC